jgi:hypothetical protein
MTVANLIQIKVVMKKAASMGAKLELCALGTLMGPEAHMAWMRNLCRVKVEETAAAVKEVGAQNFIFKARNCLGIWSCTGARPRATATARRAAIRLDKRHQCQRTQA